MTFLRKKCHFWRSYPLLRQNDQFAVAAGALQQPVGRRQQTAHPAGHPPASLPAEAAAIGSARRSPRCPRVASQTGSMPLLSSQRLSGGGVEVEQMHRGDNPPAIVGTGKPGAIGVQVVRRLDGQQAAGRSTDCASFREQRPDRADAPRPRTWSARQSAVGKRRLGQRAWYDIQPEAVAPHAAAAGSLSSTPGTCQPASRAASRK